MLTGIRAKNINCEQEAKFILDRINTVERNVAELCVAFSAHSRKAARLRDTGDEIAKTTLNYAESEEINKTLSISLVNFANTISLISDYGDLRVQNIDKKVVGEFTHYENICKHARDDVKQIYAVRSREIARKRQLDRARERTPRHRQQIIQAETELVKASTEVAKTIHNLEEHMTTFEKQKLHDLKTILLNYITTEMGYHAKCLELLTKAYQDINRIDEEADLQEFKKSLRMPDVISSSSNSKRSLFRGSQSLGSLSSLFSTPKKKYPGIPTASISKSKRVSRSEEVLDSKRQISDSESVESGSEEESEEESENTEEHVSRFVARKYLK
ncbi:FAM92 protein [Popillia japonica]|uniref:FAM92 protein n=1 Tax=Popillia japonica TaxID=7064 RepID=A0AAW1L7M0_POPJA